MPAPAGTRRGPSTSPLPQLRLGLLNVRGLMTGDGARLIQLAADAAMHKLDILLLTESHVHSRDCEARAADLLSAAAAHNHTPGWRAFWGRASGPNSTGVAVLLREDLLTRGLVTVSETHAASLPAEAHHRAKVLSVQWGGHDLQLLSAYLPNEAAAQRDFIATTLQPLRAAATAAHLSCLWAGDWNFAECDALDRHAPGPVPPPPYTPTSLSTHLATHCPGLVDVYRAQHPSCRQWTYFQPLQNNGLRASRIDRFYVSPDLAPYVLRCGTAGRYQLADHRLVVLDLQARRPSSHGPGLPRVRLHYLHHPDLRARIDTFLLAQAPPLASEAVWAWWSGLKLRWAALMRSLTLLAADRSRTARASQHVAAQAKQQAAADLEAGLPGAAATYATAEATLRRESSKVARAVVRSRRCAWLHTRETPSKLLTALLKPPAVATTIPSLKDPRTGQLLSGPTSLPAAMAAHWAGISTPPPPDPTARADVLAALRAHCTTAPQAAAAAAGSPDVTEAEVLAALRKLPPGTAPGPDGIPIDAYRKHAAALSPLLAQVFSCMGAAAARGSSAPSDFLLGAISFFYKKGPPSDPSNYRPITLLNADYRTLTRALATRLGAVLAVVISPEQSAFLPGRRMGETVWLLQLLPHLMRRHGKEAVLAFLDFAKAYDTVDRSFLFEAMDALGLGAGLQAWVRALLTGTRAMAVVNGHASLAVLFAAGVRQGCPLSPPLYLVVGEALLAWLKYRGHGIRVVTPHGELGLTAGQYADDGIAILPSLGRLPAFQADMRTFGGTTGQALGIPKVQVLRIGLLTSPDPPAASLPFPLVKVASTLGVLFSNDPIPAEQMRSFWHERIERILDRFDKLSRVPLSTFGLGYGAGSYGYAMGLYHMEFMGLPPPADLARLVRHTAALVDGRVSPRRPRSSAGRFTGITNASVPGAPSAGGFGVLPIERHVQARIMWWALTFVRTACQPGPVPPWVAVARALLVSFAPCATPLALFTPIRLGTGRCVQLGPLDSHAVPSVALASCPPLLRWAQALLCLPPMQVAVGAPALPPEVARDLPVCGNPYLTDPQGMPPEYRFRFAFSAALPVITVEHVWQAARQARSTSPSANAALRQTVDDTTRLLAALPQEWLSSCGLPRSPSAAAEARRAAEAALLSRLSLVASADAANPSLRFRLTSVPSVRVLTALQADEAAADRRPRVAAFLLEAGAPPHVTVADFVRRQAAMWRLPWENERKEVFWRLPLDAIAFYGAARFRPAGADPLPCWCGRGHVCRQHLFWQCPVARAVRMSVNAAMPPAYAYVNPTPYTLRRFQLWLAEPPPSFLPVVWRVVTLAALDAIRHGQDVLTACCLASFDRSSDRRALPPAVRATAVTQACTAAAARFWSLLEDFVSLNPTAPVGWPRDRLPPGHPFLAIQPGGHLVATAPPPGASVATVVAAVAAPVAAPPAAL